MKKSIVIFLTISLFFLFGAAMAAESEINESFDDESLAFKETQGLFDYYDILGKADSEFPALVRVRNEIVGKRPAIFENGPIGARSWVFSTGSSTRWRDVHWKHQVDIRYNFDHLMSSAAISFKYLNTRACGGRVEVIFVEYAEDGSLLWYAKKRMENWENWPGPYTRHPGTLNDRTWRDYSLSYEQADALVAGRSFNCIIIREFDITSENGSGYFDDIRIQLLAAKPPEPDTDNDGVIDKLDFCPQTPPEAQVDSMGCRLPDPVVGGGFIVVDDTREVIVRNAGQSGTNHHAIYALVNGEEIYLFDSDQENHQVSLGMLAVGTPIQFRLAVEETDYNFYTAGAEENPDGKDHVQLVSTDNPFIWECGFEDSYGTADFDFADAVFYVTGVSAVTSGPEPGLNDDCLIAENEIDAMVKKIRIREFSHKGGTLQLHMNYHQGAVDLSSGNVDVRVQLIQEGKSVQLSGQKSLKKSEDKRKNKRKKKRAKNRTKKRPQRIFYKEYSR